MLTLDRSIWEPLASTMCAYKDTIPTSASMLYSNSIAIPIDNTRLCSFSSTWQKCQYEIRVCPFHYQPRHVIARDLQDGLFFDCTFAESGSPLLQECSIWLFESLRIGISAVQAFVYIIISPSSSHMTHLPPTATFWSCLAISWALLLTQALQTTLCAFQFATWHCVEQ